MNIRITEFHDVKAEYETGKIIHRTQHPADVSKIAKFCQTDQRKPAVVYWDGNAFVVEIDPVATNAAADPTSWVEEMRTKLAAAPDKELQTVAGEIGVKWDKAASKDTMVQRILDAAQKKRGEATGA